ncbi:hypothetical protein GGR56DRAFT_424869 [Xylariaceae sp. FL0804]|nr:hypothetical protein GGR56DRAFT_424869 [Xylariaceae sp. FL0804]
MPSVSDMLNGAGAQGHPPSLPPEAADQLNHYYAIDTERQHFLQNMLQRIVEYEQRIHNLELDLDDQKASRAQYQARSNSLEGDMQNLAQKISKDSFVVVLVDGDGAKFADEYLRDPIAGAEKAALRLKHAVRDNLRDTGYGHDDIPIIVRVYANLNDLAKSLRLARIINYDDDMRLFAEHFTNSRADFDFVNVGKGKENADSKMRRMLNHYHKNIQCQKIFLAGCCHDNGYLHDLRDFSGTSGGKISLIETTFAEPGFRTLGFPMLRFDDVFRSQPLNNETKRVPQLTSFGGPSPLSAPGPIARPPQAFANLPPAFSNPPPTSSLGFLDGRTHTTSLDISSTSPALSSSSVSATAPTSPPVQVQVQATSAPPGALARTSSVVSSGNGGTSISYATAGGTVDFQNVTLKTAKPKKQPKVIYTNDDGCRIDPPTQHPSKGPAQQTYQAKFQEIRPSVFCNDHYLKGRCRYGTACDKTHDAELTPAELAIHRYKARTSLCPSGPYCVDYDCYLSHHCPRNPCNKSDCMFYKNERYGDLHLTRDQLQPATRWTEGSQLPDRL